MGSRAGRAQVQGAAQSYRAFLRSEGGLLRELKECRHDTSKVHLVCNNYGESSSSCLLSVGTLMKEGGHLRDLIISRASLNSFSANLMPV